MDEELTCSLDSLAPSKPRLCKEDELKFFRDISDRGRDRERGFLEGDGSLLFLSLPRDMSRFDGDLLSFFSSSSVFLVVDLPLPALAVLDCPNDQKDDLAGSEGSSVAAFGAPRLTNSRLTLESNNRSFCLVSSGMFRKICYVISACVDYRKCLV